METTQTAGPFVIRDASGLVVITPGAATRDKWDKLDQEAIDDLLMEHGAVLFRDFGIDSITHFEAFTDRLGVERMNYKNRTSPRSSIGERVYTSTDHPPEEPIKMHNELSYSNVWPMRLLFYCVQPSATGGETPIADSRRVLALLKESTRQKFAEKGVRYVRNMIEGIGLSWQEVYQTDRVEEVNLYCAANQVQCEWKDQDHLKTSWVSQAIRNHPVTGELTWFNHGFFYNWRSLNPLLAEIFPEEDMPFNTYYGDGTPIEQEVIEEIGEAFEKAKIIFRWHKGDLLLLDNMLMSHGRNAFAGDRKIAVAMCNPFKDA